MSEECFYYCIKCGCEHSLDSKIGKRHYPQYVPIFGGVYTKESVGETKKRAGQ